MTRPFKPDPTHAALFSAIYFRIPAGGGSVTISPAEWAAFGDLAGALNWAVAGDDLEIAQQAFYEPNTSVVYVEAATVITARPIQVPSGPFPTTDLLYASAAEYGSGVNPALRLATIRPTAGDMTGASQGLQATVEVKVGPGELIKPGSIAWYNSRLIDGLLPTPSRFFAALPR